MMLSNQHISVDVYNNRLPGLDHIVGNALTKAVMLVLQISGHKPGLLLWKIPPYILYTNVRHGEAVLMHHKQPEAQ